MCVSRKKATVSTRIEMSNYLICGQCLIVYAPRASQSSTFDKGGGATPATLAWLLSETEIPDGVKLPAGVTPAELRAFLADLVVRLRRSDRLALTVQPSTPSFETSTS